MEGASPQPNDRADATEAPPGAETTYGRRAADLSLPDPEIDSTLTPESLHHDANHEEYLRLVANPFLAVFAFLGWLVVARLILTGAAGPYTTLAALLALASLALLPRLVHYHCLDCGRTGALTEWRKHVCPSVVARRYEGRPRRFHGPTPTVQLLIWIWVFAAIVVAWQAVVWHHNS